ncbi:MAG: DUF3597 domain-containing protein [Anaerolineales bacterium]|nr:DUF3597 domain-containing protein [Anaerolineales bacterium]
MSVFKNILNKLGIKRDKAEAEKPEASESPAKPTPKATKPTPKATKPTPAQPKKPSGSDAVAAGYVPKATKPAVPAKPAAAAQPAAPAQPEAIPVVDVVSNLEKLAAANEQKLDWKVSIVDLMKLLDLDSSYKARKELAEELDCPAELMEDSAKMNTWLHKTVLQKIAENGGNIPEELLS